jgi:hypothetical protein
LAQIENSSSQIKAIFGTAENGVQTANHTKYANEIKNYLPVLHPFRFGNQFAERNSQGVCDGFGGIHIGGPCLDLVDERRVQ